MGIGASEPTLLRRAGRNADGCRTVDEAGMKSLGNVSGSPNTNSAEEVPKSFFGAVRIP